MNMVISILYIYILSHLIIINNIHFIIIIILDNAFSFLRFVDTSAQEASYLFRHSLISRWLRHLVQKDQRARRRFYSQDSEYR